MALATTRPGETAARKRGMFEMLFRYHGEPTTPLAAETEATTKSVAKTATSAVGTPATVGFMFDDLADNPDNRLPEGPDVIAALTALGTAIAATPSVGDTKIPAAYTYLGQFIDHDITKTKFDDKIQRPDFDQIEERQFAPLTRKDVAELAVNQRTPRLDLDSVYLGLAATEATEPDGRMRIGTVASLPPRNGPIKTADPFHDLPRRDPIKKNDPTFAERELDRQALIGDPRNDENLLVGQLHVAFLRSHNALMDRGLDGPAAQRAMRRRYQWAVLHDFLPRIGDEDVVNDVLDKGPTFWKVEHSERLFMPAEFSGAAYRFGHSMIREEYSHNATFNPQGIPATFNFFFTFTALGGDLAPAPGANQTFRSLPNNWIIDWPRFFSPPGQPESGGLNPARRLDARLASELGKLPDVIGVEEKKHVMSELAARNLLRGYLLGLPTGQAVAAKLGVAPLTPDELETAVPPTAQTQVKAAGLLERTPLWFYVLAEADIKADGQRLGPVGTRIIAETLWNLVFHSEDSVLKDENKPSENEIAEGEFTLKGLVKIGQDTGMPPLVLD